MIKILTKYNKNAWKSVGGCYEKLHEEYWQLICGDFVKEQLGFKPQYLIIWVQKKDKGNIQFLGNYWRWKNEENEFCRDFSVDLYTLFKLPYTDNKILNVDIYLQPYYKTTKNEYRFRQIIKRRPD